MSKGWEMGEPDSLGKAWLRGWDPGSLSFVLIERLSWGIGRHSELIDQPETLGRCVLYDALMKMNSLRLEVKKLLKFTEQSG